MPDGVHGVVIQLADSTYDFPPLTQLLSCRGRDVAAMPHNRGPTDEHWWELLWDEQPQHWATLMSTTLVTTGPDVSRRLFRDVLHGSMTATADADVFSWGGASLEVRTGTSAGITHVTASGNVRPDLNIGSALVRFV